MGGAVSLTISIWHWRSTTISRVGPIVRSYSGERVFVDVRQRSGHPLVVRFSQVDTPVAMPVFEPPRSRTELSMMKTDRPQRNVEIESLADETKWFHAIFQGWPTALGRPALRLLP